MLIQLICVVVSAYIEKVEKRRDRVVLWSTRRTWCGHEKFCHSSHLWGCREFLALIRKNNEE
jgi:hypothetical protein